MKFSDKLIDWYFLHKRDLPWRKTNDAYKIWVSEIIMQQTRVEQGLSYYERFITKYPDIFILSGAKEEELLKMWQGLGYYSRVRNMLSAAKLIVKEYNGIFPGTFNEIIKIRGIGKYTASAILSFAYNLPYPVMDGNVKRVISRYFCIEQDIKSPETEKMIFKKVNKIFDGKRASDFNQAIMEFGALQCKVSKPACQQCIFKDECKAFIKNKVSELPVVSQKTQVKTRHFYYIVPVIKLKGKQYTYIVKREADDIWKHLFQFPLIEAETELTKNDLLISLGFKELLNNKKYEIISFSEKFSHKLSHQLINAVFVHLKIFNEPENIKLKKVNVNDLNEFPVSRLTEKYLKKNSFSDFN